MNPSHHRDAVFSAPAERCKRLNDIILSHVDATKPLSVLDIGCGTGTQLFSLAGALPRANLVGVDISIPNISIAEEVRATNAHAGRISFINCDYLEYNPTRKLDLILSYSTLYLIPVDDERLFGKIADELSPGGLFVNVMPVACAYNTALTSLRRLVRTVRGRATDRLIFSMATLVHGDDIPPNDLRERVAYMYEIPQRFDGARLQDLLSRTYALESVEKFPEPHASPAQMKHGVHIFRKRTVVD